MSPRCSAKVVHRSLRAACNGTREGHRGERCQGDLDAKLGSYVGISHDAQQELERRNFRVRGSGGECCISECRFFVWRTVLASAAPFAWFRSSWHCYFRFFIFASSAGCEDNPDLGVDIKISSPSIRWYRRSSSPSPAHL